MKMAKAEAEAEAKEIEKEIGNEKSKRDYGGSSHSRFFTPRQPS